MQSLSLDVIRYLSNAGGLYLQNDSMSIRTFSLSTWSSISTDFLTDSAILGHVRFVRCERGICLQNTRSYPGSLNSHDETSYDLYFVSSVTTRPVF